jgi:hypothetical protein
VLDPPQGGWSDTGAIARVDAIPILGTGKLDSVNVGRLASELLGHRRRRVHVNRK